MALKDTLTSNLNSPYYDVKSDGTSNDDWVQFVRDHLGYIKNLSDIELIGDTVMPEVRYNVTRFLRKINIPPSMWWIVLEVNDFKNDMDFNQNIYTITPDPQGIYMRLYVPSVRLMDTLYQKWLTCSQIRKGSSLATLT